MVELLSRKEMPRKERRPKPSPLDTTPGVRRAKLEARRPLMGRLSIMFWSMVVENVIGVDVERRQVSADLDLLGDSADVELWLQGGEPTDGDSYVVGLEAFEAIRGDGDVVLTGLEFRDAELAGAVCLCLALVGGAEVGDDDGNPGQAGPVGVRDGAADGAGGRRLRKDRCAGQHGGAGAHAEAGEQHGGCGGPAQKKASLAGAFGQLRAAKRYVHSVCLLTVKPGDADGCCEDAVGCCPGA